MNEGDVILGALAQIGIEIGGPRSGGGGGGGGGGGVLYGALGARNPTSDLFTIDPATGLIATTIGPIGNALTGMAQDPTDGTLYGLTSNNTGGSSATILTINKTTGLGILVGGLGLGGRNCNDIAFDSRGQLYGWAQLSGGGQLATIDKSTGTATLIGSVITRAFLGDGISVNAADVLYASTQSSNGDLWTVDVATGTPTVVATLDGDGINIGALAFDGSGALWGSEPNDGNLLTIDPTTGHITIVGTGTIPGLDAIEWGS